MGGVSRRLTKEWHGHAASLATLRSESITLSLGRAALDRGEDAESRQTIAVQLDSVPQVSP